MTTCEAVRNKLPLFVSGELADAEIKTLQIHLSRCPFCRQERDELKRMDQYLRSNLVMETAPMVVPSARRKPVSRFLLGAAALFMLVWMTWSVYPPRPNNSNPDLAGWEQTGWDEILTLEYDYERLNDDQSYVNSDLDDSNGNISDYLYDLNDRIDYLNESQL